MNQDERNAQNALDAARLKRVERGVQAVIDALHEQQEQRWEPAFDVILASLNRALKASAGHQDGGT